MHVTSVEALGEPGEAYDLPDPFDGYGGGYDGPGEGAAQQQQDGGSVEECVDIIIPL